MTDRHNSLFDGLRFFKSHWAVIPALSALLIIPCFWHRHIEAGDLPSHTYNAWLAELVGEGKAPGLYTVWQRTNVLFDLMLLYAAKMFGFVAGPKLAVAVCVLLFFWGVFSFVAVSSGRIPWLITPLIAMLSYGYVFNMGFFNYYLSIGLACFGLALCWKGRNWDWLACGAIFCLTVLAHPIGPLWLVATLAYVALRKKVPGMRGFAIPAAVVAVFIAGHWYLDNYADMELDWLDKPFYFFNGTDQFVAYSVRCRWLAIACVAIVISWVASELLDRRARGEGWSRYGFLVELYLLSFCVICFLPQDIRPEPTSSWVGFLVNRLTIITAIFALCGLSWLKPRKLMGGALLLCAVLYFVFLYQDTAAINRLELHAEQITAAFPYGTLVIPTLTSRSRIPFVGHVVDRACIGHCFTYSNYEPPSGQFHVRQTRSSIVVYSPYDSQEMEAGNYVVKSSDPPFINIYQCNASDFTVLCSRKLEPGQTTGRPQPTSSK
jgi:hypothetical protein